jgi:hypothetical protein
VDVVSAVDATAVDATAFDVSEATVVTAAAAVVAREGDSCPCCSGSCGSRGARRGPRRPRSAGARRRPGIAERGEPRTGCSPCRTELAKLRRGAMPPVAEMQDAVRRQALVAELGRTEVSYFSTTSGGRPRGVRTL